MQTSPSDAWLGSDRMSYDTDEPLLGSDGIRYDAGMSYDADEPLLGRMSYDAQMNTRRLE